MPDTISRQGATDREFIELICADPVWLRAEFDAIVAADGAPVLPPSHAGDFRPRDTGNPAAKRVPATLWRAWPPEHRERSPPARSRHTRQP
ncbi:MULTISPECIES: hypothetical protein [Amycolatopsis]|uniref:Uncharacterized protein n=1 Tax=Amycolatopsis dendrobii TaxID=2760662 RepID=A0A7W3ZFL0_9PSEU|nr:MULTISPECIES: hypothetical protein [Amycolatopsis]MBB1159178.1 hypothetical protein [Amycolatopsis dendrobii]UKD58283.1 hypothetical protein L3Q65_16605 [Amycolatopsis sp. FU40]